MATCDIEIAGLPILTGCPGDNEYFIVTNAIGGEGLGLYGRRKWSDVKSCLLDSIQFKFLQFTIGQPGSPMNAGDISLTLDFLTLGITKILQDSLFITLGGPELPRESTDQLSYGVVYSSTDVVINLLAPVVDGQLYIIHYAYV